MAHVPLRPIGRPRAAAVDDRTFAAHRDALAPRLETLRARREEVRAGWGDKYIGRVHDKGKLTARERIDLLRDDGDELFEVGTFVNYGERFGKLHSPAAGVVTAVALLGLVINLGVAWLLAHGESTLNTRAALLHVMGDLLGSVAALASGLVIQYTGWTPADPLLSLFICALILFSTLRLAREAVHTLLEGVPQGLTLQEVGQRMAAVEGVESVHDLHIWSLSSRHAALSAHVVVHDLEAWPRILAALLERLQADFEIGHATLQPELFKPVLYAIDEPEKPLFRP